MKAICSLIFLLYSFIGTAQNFSLITYLNEPIVQTSGLIHLNQKLITHNDGSYAGETLLYEIDSLNGSVNRQVHIANVLNKDWEDICYDEEYIYLADMGNNNGNRTDLTIYKILIADYFGTENDTVSADEIKFNYQDQINFEENTYDTNFDAETLISIGDSLYIFTKNWNDNYTNVYSLPKDSGNYEVSKIYSINSEGLVTGGIYNSELNEIVLCGYEVFIPFIIKISNVNNQKISFENFTKSYLDIPLNSSNQIESITSFNSNYLITSEESILGEASLFKLSFPDEVSTLDNQSKYKTLKRKIDIFGNESNSTNQVLFYLFDDGSIDKKIIIK